MSKKREPASNGRAPGFTVSEETKARIRKTVTEVWEERINEWIEDSKVIRLINDQRCESFNWVDFERDGGEYVAIVQPDTEFFNDRTRIMNFLSLCKSYSVLAIPRNSKRIWAEGTPLKLIHLKP